MNMAKELSAVEKAVRAYKKMERKEWEAQRAEDKLHDIVRSLTVEEVVEYVQRTEDWKM